VAPPITPVCAPARAGILGGMIETWVLGLIERLGALGVGIAVALENIFPPLPSELFLPLAGFAASQGRISVVSAIAAATVGSVVGALALYAIGAVVGRDRLWAIADRMPLVDVADLDKAEAWFARHGDKAVLIGRCVPIVRSLISVPAGLERMPVARFAALTAIGSLVWNTLFVSAGYALGTQWHKVEQYAGIGSKVVLVALLAAAAWYVVTKVRATRRPQDASPSRNEDEDEDEREDGRARRG
jgi:membrane protein DedA with SNARE-associated domain